MFVEVGRIKQGRGSIFFLEKIVRKWAILAQAPRFFSASYLNCRVEPAVNFVYSIYFSKIILEWVEVDMTINNEFLFW